MNGGPHHVLLGISQLVADCAEVADLDIKALLADADGAVALEVNSLPSTASRIFMASLSRDS